MQKSSPTLTKPSTDRQQLGGNRLVVATRTTNSLRAGARQSRAEPSERDVERNEVNAAGMIMDKRNERAQLWQSVTRLGEKCGLALVTAIVLLVAVIGAVPWILGGLCAWFAWFYGRVETELQTQLRRK